LSDEALAKSEREARNAERDTPMPFDQSNRIAALRTPFGADELGLLSFTVSEELGQIPSFTIEAVCERKSLDPNQILGHEVGITFNVANGKKRYFHGYAIRFNRAAIHGRYFVYSMTVVPWLWFLTQSKNCRVFQNKSVVDIAKKVFQDRGFSDIELKLQGSHTAWEYCIQYRESDYNFVSRLLQQEGIYYFYKYEESKNILVLADSPSAHEPFPGYDQIKLVRESASDEENRERIREFGIHSHHVAAKFTHTDYDFEKPRVNLRAQSEIAGSYAKANAEVYDYPGEYIQHDDGDSWARIRMEELNAQSERGYGETDSRGIAVGSVFTLTESPFQEENKKYLVISAQYQVNAGEFGSQRAGEEVVQCQFTVQPGDKQFRPKTTSAKPKVYGVHTAVVVGPKGEEIYTDKYSRIKVQFHWDREGKKDENSSCWVRVAQPWAGKNWGAVSIPRIGQEVVINFLEGDPDQPLVIGSVYNADQMPPYELPSKMVVSGIKSQTHKGQGYNEIAMDDTAGKEQLRIHAQYNMDTTVEHDQTNTVHGKMTETIDKDTTIHITQGNLEHKVQTGTALYDVKGALTENYQTTQDTTVKGNITITSVSGDITLHTGASKLVLKNDGKIELTGVNIAIDGGQKVYTHGGQVVSEADTNHEISGQAVKSNGAVTNTVQGAMVMLNP
jgi:type VI secretion system secreted protein VgrG